MHVGVAYMYIHVAHDYVVVSITGTSFLKRAMAHVQVNGTESALNHACTFCDYNLHNMYANCTYVHMYMYHVHVHVHVMFKLYMYVVNHICTWGILARTKDYIHQ